MDETRGAEIKAYGYYCDIKNICSAIYFNAGVIISSLVFLLASKESLELGKVFSTLALLACRGVCWRGMLCGLGVWGVRACAHALCVCANGWCACVCARADGVLACVVRYVLS